MYIIIDNYDSFTYNLFQYLTEVVTEEVKVFRNDKVSIEKIEEIEPRGIVISPGPGRPEEAGISVEVVKHFAGKVPILGVCLGHQAIGYAFGTSITTAKNIVHGKTDFITFDAKGLFRNIPSPSSFTRYHSLVIAKDTVPEELMITAYSTDGEIMGIRHKQYPIEGIQFHPESIASEYGMKILQNFINYKREPFQVSKALLKITSGADLSSEEASSLMEELTDGQLTQNQIAAFLTALSAKKIYSGELAAFASVLGKKKKSLSFKHPLLDTCGTGGDGKGSFNISSMAAVVASSCGAYVAKHGNRGVSSKSGSAEFYKELGIPIELDTEEVKLLLEETGFAFLFAPLYHGSMKHAAQVRRELGIKTVMNILGPLLNPAGAEYQIIGVYSEELCEPVVEALAIMGRKRAMVVHGLDGFDEISVSAPTKICEIESGGGKKEYLFDPQELGIKRYKEEDLKGGTPAENAAIAEQVLNSGGREAIKDAVLLNAGAALYTYNLSESIRDGYLLAKETLESGKTLDKLEQIRETGKRLTGVSSK
ncbi:MAG: bifunctional anthranilate synthase component II/anthranilate phosphoribosyltransferase [Spirochaetota bacterium]|nr:MAG: bifunctional anthranilate synthase component II/anthranilate phosphoribosyltransferase [Spirochaetota bacterium]